MTNNKDEIECIKLFISSLMNEVQNDHSKLLATLKQTIGKTKEFEDTMKILIQIYDSKIELLNHIYNKIQSL